ncbi:ATP synthase subunit delta, mitochondrial [Trichoplax sp. H2]|uniref:ATP synthase F(1) complex subunit delta, mitochondrial n=1 Tax=Trichoplax adhaerens TaxID=10228 RepID=B3S2H9_TRIAD|nr:expressed hypothetical protein [Trichoplax adhaerens]EDV23098.1 expressed hypothetical protein [Trichoplax adhaerens]RDD47731.1 ATP synthase subunit delta, mitochondrial [Trichoplax sp. H2]|eukprot:XP_002114008.1 expressed hypothetical protein [Trichoplax adhaerens]
MLSARLTRQLVRFNGRVVLQQSRNYADAAPASQLLLTFASPNQAFYSKQNVKQVDVPSFSGNFGILPSHVPTIAVIKPGIVTVYEEDGTTSKYFASSGNISVNADSTVQILAEEACPLDQLDAQAAREGLEKANQQVTSASSDEAKAEAQAAAECYEEIIKATN